MDKTELRAIFENEYPEKEQIFETLIKPIFVKAKDTTLSNQIEIAEADKKQIKSFSIISQVRGAFPITFADVELQDSVALKRSRVNIQNCVRKILENDSNAIIFFHFTDNKKEWRVSYVHRAATNKESTNAKRYTYLCGTEHACRTIAERFETLKGLSTIKDDDMLNAFGVEPLSKEFFDRYREHYADLVEYISGKRFVKKGGKFVEEKTKNANGAFREAFDGNDKLVRDYVKKMMGRLVFLHFLQKKGWLGVAENADWGNGDKNFIFNLFENASEEVKKDFLESALEVLFFKTLNTDRGENAIAPNELCKIYGSTIRIPYLNGGLFEEDELDKKKVKFKKEHFASLLEFFNQYNFTIDETDQDDQEIGVDPEMLGKIFENLLEDNKDKGAFYTPKEIVQYMCRESLIAYLSNDLTNLSDKIREFVTNHDDKQFSDGEKETLLNKLKEVKICDPAVGSGAFPMGILNELFACRIALGEDESISEIKKQIVRENIYGVDIEKGAVDIARLRFWLAIIVDEKEPLPLPNLDYKIMQGNSLLESYKGIDLSELIQKKEKVGAKDLFGKSIEIQSGFDFDSADNVKAITENMLTYFDTNNHEERSAIRDSLKDAVFELLDARGFDNNTLEELKQFDLHENSEFFLWHTWFHDVFNRPTDRNGFDIVIGNPPYFVIKSDTAFKSEYEKNYPELKSGRMNIYQLFFGLSARILSKNGILGFIHPKTLLSDAYLQATRKYLISQFNNITILNIVSRTDVFDNVLQAVIVSLWHKSKNEHYRIAEIQTKDDFDNMKYIEPCKSQFLDSEGKLIVTGKKAVYEIIEKISLLNTEHCCFKTGNYEWNKLKAYLSSEKQDNSIRLIYGENIQRLEFAQSKKRANTTFITGIDANCLEIPAIITQRTTSSEQKWRIFAAIINPADFDCKVCTENSTNVFEVKDLDKAKYYLGVLLSKFIDFYFRIFNSNTHVSSGELNALPIPTATKEQQQPIIDLVDKILEAKKADTSEMEREIDEKVYALYGLTAEEIAVVEEKTDCAL